MLSIKAATLLSSLLALVLCAGQALGWTSQMVGSPKCPNYTKLLPRYSEYRHRCEAEAGPSGSDSKWPCFTFWSGGLSNVVVTTPDVKNDPDKDVLIVKNGDMYGK